MRYMMCMLIAAMFAMSSTVAQADDSRSINFIVFEKSKAGFEFDPIMFGDFSDFIRAMEGAQLLLLSRSAKSINGDVINLQQDILKEAAVGDFEDVGVNCQLTFTHDGKGNDLEYHLTGDCQIHGQFNGQSMKLKSHIPTTDLPDAKTIGKNIWMQIYENKKSGIAFYANVN